MDYLSLLPHTPPMRLVEEVVSVDPGQQAVARRVTRPDDFFFQGHFPGQPVVPAIVLIELLAQTGGLAAGTPRPGEPHQPRALRVAAVDGFRFPAGCGAGVTLEATAKVAGRMGGLFKIEGTVTADGTLVARGALTLADVPASRG
ncbi:3-hydroxyacyl-ACP dehydratase FabZ family protein [Luteitalea sp.]|uniref:3-hydroxyacyl-ACP dehydratase FabZ family protein n=1 Tax=Luteitalea sp. TaxID=2004800 RepID=UPI0037C9781C